MTASRTDQETGANRTAKDEYTTLYSCIPKDLRALEKDDRFERVDGGVYSDGLAWGMFRIRSSAWSPVSGAKRRVVLTLEQRQARAERLRRTLGRGEEVPDA